MNFVYFEIVLSDFVVMCLIIATTERIIAHQSDTGAFFSFWMFVSIFYFV